MLYLTLDRTWVVGDDDDAPALPVGVSTAALGLWLAVLFWGMMLPFLGTAF